MPYSYLVPKEIVAISNFVYMCSKFASPVAAAVKQKCCRVSPNRPAESSPPAVTSLAVGAAFDSGRPIDCDAANPIKEVEHVTKMSSRTVRRWQSTYNAHFL